MAGKRFQIDIAGLEGVTFQTERVRWADEGLAGWMVVEATTGAAITKTSFGGYTKQKYAIEEAKSVLATVGRVESLRAYLAECKASPEGQTR